MGARLLRLLTAGLLVAVLLFGGRSGADLVSDYRSLLPSVLTAVALTIALLMLSLDYSTAKAPSGDLERLLGWRRTAPPERPVRESRPRVVRTPDPPPPGPAEDGLDHLLTRKRLGSLGRHPTDQSSPLAPREDSG